MPEVKWLVIKNEFNRLPQYQDKVDTYSQPAFFGEIAFMFWLLIKGAKPKPLAGSVSAAAVG